MHSFIVRSRWHQQRCYPRTLSVWRNFRCYMRDHCMRSRWWYKFAMLYAFILHMKIFKIVNYCSSYILGIVLLSIHRMWMWIWMCSTLLNCQSVIQISLCVCVCVWSRRECVKCEWDVQHTIVAPVHSSDHIVLWLHWDFGPYSNANRRIYWG